MVEPYKLAGGAGANDEDKIKALEIANKRYELSLKGITEWQEKLIPNVEEINEGLEKQGKKSEESSRKWVSGLEQASRVAGIAGGVITKQMAGGFQTSAEAVNTFSSLTSLVPGHIGAAASAITGVFGAALSAINFRWEQMIGRVKQATTAVLSGSQTMSAALANVGVSSLTEEFGILTERIVRAGEQQRQFFGRALRPGERGPMGFEGVNVGEGINEAVQRMQAAQTATRELFNNPQFLRMNEQVQARRGAERARGAVVSSEVETRAAGAETRGLQAGRGVEWARDYAARQRMEDQFIDSIRRESETRDQAARRFRTSNDEETVRQRRNFRDRMVELQAQQQAQRQAEAARGLEQQNVAGRQQIQILQAQIGLIRQQGTSMIPMVDRSSELVELQRQRDQGLITEEQRQRRLGRIQLEIRQQELANAARAGQDIVNRNLRPLETARRDLRDLNVIRARGGFGGAGGEEGFQREQVRIAQAMIAAAGPLERLGPALTQGSAAAYSAISRAEREQRAADPERALRAALSGLERQAEQQSALQREMVNAMQALRAEGFAI